MCEIVAARGPLVVVDPEPTVFSELAERSARGRFLRGPASALVPAQVDQIAAAISLVVVESGHARSVGRRTGFGRLRRRKFAENL
ncbi:MAG TPA: hypothetical protein VI456_05685 [Polyangia bacterium]